jgi:hypothetical protein
MTVKNDPAGANDTAGGNYVQKVREDTNRILADLKCKSERLRTMVAALESDRSHLGAAQQRASKRPYPRA